MPVRLNFAFGEVMFRDSITRAGAKGVREPDCRAREIR